MDRLKALAREPALLIDAFETLIVFLVAWGFLSLTGDQQTTTIAVFIALCGLAKGFTTKPFPVTVVPDLGRAALVWVVSIGVLPHVTPDQITIAVTMLGTLLSVVMRGQITPRKDAVTHPQGAGSGPLAGNRDDRGAVDLAMALIVIGIVLIIVGLLTAYAVFWIGVVLLVIGLVLAVVGRSRTRV